MSVANESKLVGQSEAKRSERWVVSEAERSARLNVASVAKRKIGIIYRDHSKIVQDC